MLPSSCCLFVRCRYEGRQECDADESWSGLFEVPGMCGGVAAAAGGHSTLLEGR